MHFSNSFTNGDKVLIKASDVYNIYLHLSYIAQINGRNIVLSPYTNDVEGRIGALYFDVAAQTIHAWHPTNTGRPYSPTRVHPGDRITVELLENIKEDLNGFFDRTYKRGPFKYLRLKVLNGQNFEFDIDLDNGQEQSLPAPLPNNLNTVQIQFLRAWQNTSVTINGVAVANETNVYDLTLSSGKT